MQANKDKHNYVDAWLFCWLTDHEVGYGSVYAQGEDPHGDEVNEHLGQEEDWNTIVATHILMAATSKGTKSIAIEKRIRYH
jgi:hypothetical protein